MNVPITYIGAKMGWWVKVKPEMAKRLGREHPTTEAYSQYRNISEIKKGRERVGPIIRKSNPAYDELALFYAVEGGVGKYYERVSGMAIIDEDGANTWVPGTGNESYLKFKGSIAQQLFIVRELEVLMTDRITGQF
jgi:hypothetical protein